MTGCDEKGNPLDPGHPWYTDTRTVEQVIADALAEKLEKYRRGYHDGNMGALEAALNLCHDKAMPLPDWATQALRECLRREQRGESKGERGKRKWVARYTDDMKDLDRHSAVQDGREHGIRWMDVYAQASEVLYGTPDHADAIEKSYKRVEQRMRTEPGRYLILRHKSG